jgi:hypothetical protein
MTESLYFYWMKKALAILIFTTITLIANAQKNDTTIYRACAWKDNPGPLVGSTDKTDIPADECPQFPEGYNKMFNFFKKNLKWPNKPGITNEKYKVFVYVVIEKNGSLTNISITHSPSQEYSKE